MKRTLAAILLLLYLTLNTGFVVSFHYCMDRLASSGLGHSSEKKCGKCGMENGTNKCCRDEVRLIKLTTDHLQSKAAVSPVQLPVMLPADPVVYLAPFFNFDARPEAVSHGPPPDASDTYLHNRVFRI